jgi:hypothetical protein
MFGKRIPCSEVVRVKLVTGAQTGSTTYYTLSLERREGASVNAGALIKSKQHAEWLAEEIEKAVASCRPSA